TRPARLVPPGLRPRGRGLHAPGAPAARARRGRRGDRVAASPRRAPIPVHARPRRRAECTAARRARRGAAVAPRPPRGLAASPGASTRGAPRRDAGPRGPVGCARARRVEEGPVSDVPWRSDRPLDAATVAKVIEAQLPHLAPCRATFLAEGWDTEAYLVNDSWIVRFPKRASVVPSLDVERVLLPRLAPMLPVPIPAPTIFGEPSADFPF